MKKGSDIRTIEDLAGKTVGVQKGTTGATYAKENADAGDLRSYPEIDDAFNALVAGQVEAVMFDLPGTQEAARTLEGLEVAAVVRHRRGARHGIRGGQRRAARGRQQDPRRDQAGRHLRRALSQVVQEGSAQEDPRRATHSPS